MAPVGLAGHPGAVDREGRGVIAAEVRQATGIDVALLVLIAALAVLGCAALVVAVLCDPGPELDEFEDLDDHNGPRSLRP